MKTVRLFFLLVFVCGIFSVYTGTSQIKNSKVENFELTLRIKVNNEIKEYELTGVEIIKITPSGNLSRILTFKIDPADPIMEIANPFAFLRVTAKGDFDGDNEVEIITDEFAVLTNSGNLKLVYHINGNSK